MRRSTKWIPPSRLLQVLWVTLIAVVAVCSVLPVHAQASWYGQIQCQLTIQSAGYAHQEIQTWKLTGEPPAMGTGIPIYSAAWTVTGQGATQREQPAQKLAGQWKVETPSTRVSLAILKRSSDQRLLIKRYTPAVYVPAAVTGIRRLAVQGAAESQSTFQLPQWEWPLPVIEDEGNSKDVSGSATVMIAATLTPMQPGGPSSPANCVWHFTYGANAPALTVNPPAVMTAPPTVSRSTPPALSTSQPTNPQTTGTGTSQTPANPPAGVDTAKNRTPVAEYTAPPPSPSPLTITAASSACNTAGSFNISYNYREFLAGATTVDFGPDITVESVTVPSDSQLTVQLLIPPTASPGAHTVTVKIGSKTITAPGAFTVTSPCAQSQGMQLTLNPNSGVQNVQNLTVQATGQGFVQGVTTADFGPGITVNSINVGSATRADINISIASIPQYGSRSVTLKTANRYGSSNFEVVRAGSTSLIPSTTTTPCNIIDTFSVGGQQTHFVPGTSQVNFGPDITVLDVSVTNSANLKAKLYIPANAAPGVHSVTVTTGGETATTSSGLTVTTPCAATKYTGLRYNLVNVSPVQGVIGTQNLTVEIPGVNLAQGVTAADFGPGITLNSLTVISENRAQANISILPTARPIVNDVTVTTANNVFQGSFGLVDGGHTTLSMATATAACNQVISFPIAGNHTNFATGVTSVDFGPDITVLNVSATNSANLTARVYIPPSATVGAHTVTATTAAEVATLASGFTVTSPCAVKQTATGGVTPYFGVVGMQNMVVHIKSSNLVQGLTTADFGPDITVNSITVTDQNSADVNISISPSAQASSRSVTLTTANVVANVKGLDGADFYVMH